MYVTVSVTWTCNWAVNVTLYLVFQTMPDPTSIFQESSQLRLLGSRTLRTKNPFLLVRWTISVQGVWLWVLTAHMSTSPRVQTRTYLISKLEAWSTCNWPLCPVACSPRPTLLPLMWTRLSRAGCVAHCVLTAHLSNNICTDDPDFNLPNLGVEIPGWRWNYHLQWKNGLLWIWRSLPWWRSLSNLVCRALWSPDLSSLMAAAGKMLVGDSFKSIVVETIGWY